MEIMSLIMEAMKKNLFPSEFLRTISMLSGIMVFFLLKKTVKNVVNHQNDNLELLW